MSYELPTLPYGYDALAPYIDEQTLRIHHDKHHGGYVTKLNQALKGHDQYATGDIADLMPKIAGLPAAIRTAVQRNGGQHYNHNLYWECMRPAGKSKSEPSGALADAIKSAFGDFGGFQAQLTEAATTCFGSGWAWLYVDAAKKLGICSCSNEINPLMKGIAECSGQPLLVVDVWEHAYYLKYQNRRAEYVEAWWKLVDWEKAGQRFSKAV